MNGSHPAPAVSVGVLVPSGMLGAGFPPETIARGIELGADVIAVDAGSTDSGPHYLGTGTSKNPTEAVRRDLEILLPAAAAANIPLIIGSCGTSGTDAGVDWVAGIVEDILERRRLHRNVAKIYSSLRAEHLMDAFAAGHIRPLPPALALEPSTLASCSQIVGVMGYEPIANALAAGAEIVLAGRATDTAISVVLPLVRGMPPGPSWHAAKIVECGGQCTTNPRAGGVFARIDHAGFTIEPLDPDAACTPTSVAAHMLYESANPFTMREPGGTIEVADARYTAVDERVVRVEGSRFEPAHQYTIKLEGAALSGYETVSFVGIRDPLILRSIDEWAEFFTKALTGRVETVLELAPGSWGADLRLYGYNAILGELETEPATPAEVGVMLLVSAQDQQTATEISKLANPLLLHLPLPAMNYLPSFAFATSPAHIDRGAAYEFVLNHVVDVDSPTVIPAWLASVTIVTVSRSCTVAPTVTSATPVPVSLIEATSDAVSSSGSPVTVTVCGALKLVASKNSAWVDNPIFCDSVARSISIGAPGAWLSWTVKSAVDPSFIATACDDTTIASTFC